MPDVGGQAPPHARIRRRRADIAAALAAFVPTYWDQWAAACSGRRGHEANLAALCAGVDDWSAWVQEARRERLSGAVWSSLKDSGLQSLVPEQALGDLQGQWRQAVAANALVHMHLSEIGARLDQENIGWILLKGPSVADVLYADPGARPMADIDILIKPQDLDRCLRAIALDGWSLREDMHPLYIKITHAVALKTEPYPAMLEVHHNLLGTVPLPCEEILWDSTEKVSIGDRKVAVLGAADRALHLGIHAVLHHGLTSSAQLLDVVLAFLRLDVEGWGALVEHSTKLNVVEDVYAALEAARIRQGYSAPVDIVAELSRSRPGRLRRGATRLALVDAGGHAGMTVSRLIMTRSWFERWRYLKFVLFPPREWLAVAAQHPAAGAYTRRAFRGFCKALRQLLSGVPARREKGE